MTINFAAANMAGYNNPQIEVFRAVLNNSDELVQYPSKTDILNCINRGALPFILLFMTNGDAFIPLPVTVLMTLRFAATIPRLAWLYRLTIRVF